MAVENNKEQTRAVIIRDISSNFHDVTAGRVVGTIFTTAVMPAKAGIQEIQKINLNAVVLLKRI